MGFVASLSCCAAVERNRSESAVSLSCQVVVERDWLEFSAEKKGVDCH